jgi:hypothetical protein
MIFNDEHEFVKYLQKSIQNKSTIHGKIFDKFCEINEIMFTKSGFIRLSNGKYAAKNNFVTYEKNIFCTNIIYHIISKKKTKKYIVVFAAKEYHPYTTLNKNVEFFMSNNYISDDEISSYIEKKIKYFYERKLTNIFCPINPYLFGYTIENIKKSTTNLYKYYEDKIIIKRITTDDIHK